MAQVFHPGANTISKVSIIGTVLGVLTLGSALYASNVIYGNNVYVPIEQPVQFSHKHHVGDDGIDCRYCHTSVDKSSFAGIPPTQTCMTCHSQLWSDSPMLQVVQDSYRTGKPIQWRRVHDLPDHVYFNHSVHVKKGVACVTCHGQIDNMPQTWKVKNLAMDWCTNCHKHPQGNLRPKEFEFSMSWQPPADKNARNALQKKLMSENHIRSAHQLTNCSTCHR